MSSTLLLRSVSPLVLLALGLVVVANAGISDECLQCICKLEGCDSQVGKCRQDSGSLSCGPYQIKEPYWIDGGSKGGDYETCTKEVACSEETVRAYMDRYGPDCRSNPTCEDYMRMHNGGPTACQSGTSQYEATTRYWNKAKKSCGF